MKRTLVVPHTLKVVTTQTATQIMARMLTGLSDEERSWGALARRTRKRRRKRRKILQRGPALRLPVRVTTPISPPISV
jgi:hypothetical protein